VTYFLYKQVLVRSLQPEELKICFRTPQIRLFSLRSKIYVNITLDTPIQANLMLTW